MRNTKNKSKKTYWIKDVHPISKTIKWAYTDVEVGSIFNLHWPNVSKNFVRAPQKDDYIIIKQHRKLTHLVTPVDNTVLDSGDKQYPFMRKVKVIDFVHPNIAVDYAEIFDFSLQGGAGGNCVRFDSYKKSSDKTIESTIQKLHQYFHLPLYNLMVYPGEEIFVEGNEKLVKHKVKERNPKIVTKAKERFLKKNGKLFCEVCGFTFKEKYKNGENFIEAHHLKPVAEMSPGEEVKIKDIVLVCSNCHRMIHRHNPLPKRKNLKDILK